MKMVKLLFLILLSSAAAGCAGFLGEPGSFETVSGTGQKASPAIQFRELEDWLSRNMLSITAGRDGMNDHERAFSQGAVIAYGEASGLATSANPAQKRLTAQRAAEVVAQRNLADFFAAYERFGEVRFRSYTVKLDAFLKGATTVASEYDSASDRAAVLLKLDLRGAGGFAP